MPTKQEIDRLEQGAVDYYNGSDKLWFEIEDRQEELDGILRAYDAMNTVSAQVLRRYYLAGGVIHD